MTPSQDEKLARDIVESNEFIYAQEFNREDMILMITVALSAKTREIEELRSKLEELEAESRLSKKLCNILMNHVGETGLSEGAVDVLERKLSELKSLRDENERLREKFKTEQVWRLEYEEDLFKEKARLEVAREAFKRIKNRLPKILHSETYKIIEEALSKLEEKK